MNVDALDNNEMQLVVLGAGRKMLDVKIRLTTLKLELLDNLIRYLDVGELCGCTELAASPQMQKHFVKTEGEST